MWKWGRAQIMAISAGMVVACASTIRPTNDPERLKDFAFLQPGITSAEEVKARLGNPFAVYEDGHVLTYHFEIIDGKFQATLKRDANFRLVLVYRTDLVLERWSLVKSGI